MKDQAGRAPGYYSDAECDVAAFEKAMDRVTDGSECPHAAEVVSEIPVYDVAALSGMLDRPEERRALMAEWAAVLHYGAGAVALRGAYADTTVLDDATAIYDTIIAEEKAASGGGADHFAAAGSNDRIWNSLQKLCLRAPQVFLRYFGNPAIAAVCEAWLGPNYQMTAQVNLVHPGGAAQEAHRDYHLGFQTAQHAETYPAHVHRLSPCLTLQGAIAHCDMPVESGPTKLLPFSQTYGPGYAAFRRADIRAVFDARCVQVPLAKGDALFFNPALFHAAGANTSAGIHRMANLLQVSSAFGRAMETVDRDAMCRAVYPHLETVALSDLEMAAAIAACAEGYPFPTNLDTDPPVGGLAPESPQGLMRRAWAEGMSKAAFSQALATMAAKRSP
ncbi:MAG: phytanoyl-CoA dioxygenase family protein [Pseudomonadota bacterium]